MRRLVASLAIAALLAGFACGGSSPDARYPSREEGCPVKSYPGPPAIAVDELGPVKVECAAGGGTCERQLMNAVCARGGDVVWGVADNALTATSLAGHAAHSRRVTQGPRERGCTVQVVASGGAPSGRTENIGPVTALCSDDDSREACLRELEDQVCLMGGDLLWEVDGPTPEATSNGTGQRMHGRAAHTK